MSTKRYSKLKNSEEKNLHDILTNKQTTTSILNNGDKLQLLSTGLRDCTNNNINLQLWQQADTEESATLLNLNRINLRRDC